MIIRYCIVDAISALSDRHRVVYLGDIPGEILAYWDKAVTPRCVLTGERRQHYLAEHPEVSELEYMLPLVVSMPDEVHRNRFDRQVAIFYKRLNDRYHLRSAIWLSHEGEKQNSVHSLRVARAKEVLKGREEGRVVWARTE